MSRRNWAAGLVVGSVFALFTMTLAIWPDFLLSPNNSRWFQAVMLVLTPGMYLAMGLASNEHTISVGLGASINFVFYAVFTWIALRIATGVRARTAAPRRKERQKAA